MQDNGSMAREGDGHEAGPPAAPLTVDESFDGFPVEDGAGEETVPAVRVRRRDPVVQWLIITIIVVIILWLASLVSAMMWGLLSAPTVPRTSAERDLMALSTQVEGGKANTQVYARYVATLISAGQLSKAEEALTQSLKTSKKDRSYLYAEQADLAYARKDYAGAVAAADKAMTEANKELKAFVDANVAAERKATAGAVVPASYSQAALTKAESLLALKKWALAIKTLDVYLKQNPTDADILTQRADAKVQVGDKVGAAVDYREALKFIPDYQPAIAGLKRIGASR
jgi:tetratricopeptide (TPR) repeat protein